MRPGSGTPASSAAAPATAAKRSSAMSARAPASVRMYATSAAVRLLLRGTKFHPAWNSAMRTTMTSARLGSSVATGSPGCRPRSRRACTSWLACLSISPAVHSRPSASITATRSGSAAAAAQKPRTSGGRHRGRPNTCSPTMFLLISVVPPAMDAWRTASRLWPQKSPFTRAPGPMRSTASAANS